MTRLAFLPLLSSRLLIFLHPSSVSCLSPSLPLSLRLSPLWLHTCLPFLSFTFLFRLPSLLLFAFLSSPVFPSILTCISSFRSTFPLHLSALLYLSRFTSLAGHSLPSSIYMLFPLPQLICLSISSSPDKPGSLFPSYEDEGRRGGR